MNKVEVCKIKHFFSLIVLFHFEEKKKCILLFIIVFNFNYIYSSAHKSFKGSGPTWNWIQSCTPPSNLNLYEASCLLFWLKNCTWRLFFCGLFLSPRAMKIAVIYWGNWFNWLFYTHTYFCCFVYLYSSVE